MGGDHAATISGGTPSCANSHYLRGVLREKWGWKDGFIVSDCQAIAIIKAGHGYRTAEVGKTVSFGVFPLCLSRACLGKIISLAKKDRWAKKTLFVSNSYLVKDDDWTDLNAKTGSGQTFGNIF